MESCDLASLWKAFSRDFCRIAASSSEISYSGFLHGELMFLTSKPQLVSFLILKHSTVYYTPKEILTLTKWGVRDYWIVLFCGLFIFFNARALSTRALLRWVSKFANLTAAWKFQIALNGSVARGHNTEVAETRLHLLVVTTWNSDPVTGVNSICHLKSGII